MDNFKTFYNEKNGKYILFFGFYLLFFIFLAFYIRNINNNKEVEPPKEEEKIITTYDISNLINNDFTYSIEINDNTEITNFNGSKSNVDYANYPNRYFLDIYNINQLLKRSKLVKSEGNILTYSLANKEIDDILLSNTSTDDNTIEVYVNTDTTVNKIILDLTKYLNKDNYQIIINYDLGETNENSSS